MIIHVYIFCTAEPESTVVKCSTSITLIIGRNAAKAKTTKINILIEQFDKAIGIKIDCASAVDRRAFTKHDACIRHIA